MKIDMVLMAAGESRRFGRENKLLHEINGRSMISRAIENAVLVKNRIPHIVGTVYVVSRYEEVREIIQDAGIIYIHNDKSHLGISASIHLGVESSDKEHALLFMVCDQPYMKAETICGLMESYLSSGKSMACVADEKGEMYNPCVFSPKWREELLKIQGDKGGKGILKAHESEVCRYVVTDERELVDIDESCTAL